MKNGSQLPGSVCSIGEEYIGYATKIQNVLCIIDIEVCWLKKFVSLSPESGL